MDEEVIFDITFYTDPERETAVDPDDVTLTVEAPNGSVSTPSVSEDGARPENVGKYTASKTVDQYGIWNWKWLTDTPRIVKQGSFLVEDDLI
jgi:hypothetical protein